MPHEIGLSTENARNPMVVGKSTATCTDRGMFGFGRNDGGEGFWAWMGIDAHGFKMGFAKGLV
jgi:hypothetical protein